MRPARSLPYGGVSMIETTPGQRPAGQRPQDTNPHGQRPQDRDPPDRDQDPPVNRQTSVKT